MQSLAGNVPAHIYLWDSRVLYAGPSLEPRYRSYGCAALVVSVEGNLTVHRQAQAVERVECRACLVGPGLPVWIDSDGPSLMVLFLDSFQHDRKAIEASAGRKTGDILWSFPFENQLVAMARKVLKTSPPPQVIQGTLIRMGLPDKNQLDPTDVDPRVVRAVAMIRAKRTQNITTENLAAAVSLSVPRVVQLFREYLGVSAGRYRQWHRLHATTLAIAQGQTFTKASVASGFSDLAHFSNTFHGMMGAMPSRLLRANEGVRFHIDSQLATQGFSTLSGINSATPTLC